MAAKVLDPPVEPRLLEVLTANVEHTTLTGRMPPHRGGGWPSSDRRPAATLGVPGKIVWEFPYSTWFGLTRRAARLAGRFQGPSFETNADTGVELSARSAITQSDLGPRPL